MDNTTLVLIIVFISGIAIYADAKKIGARRGLISGLGDMGPGGWLVVTWLLWIVALPLYLIKRDAIEKAALAEVSAPPAANPRGTADPVRLIGAVVIVAFIAWFVLQGMIWLQEQMFRAR